MNPQSRAAGAAAFALVLAFGFVMIAGGAAGEEGTEANVTITRDGLSPETITVTVGATVTWHNGGWQTVWLSSEPLAGGEDPLFLLRYGGGEAQPAQACPSI